MTLHLESGAGRRILAGTLSALLVLAFVFSALPGSALAAQTATCAQNHSVVAGDTLSGISVKYDVSIQEIATANNLTEPYTLSVGQTLCIPGAAAATTPSATSTATDEDDDEETASTGKEPAMTLAVAGNLLSIKTANFPTQSNFYVRASVPDRGVAVKWTKIGLMKTKKEGAIEKSFRLPKDLRKAPVLNICIKNALTDDTLCRRVTTGVQP